MGEVLKFPKNPLRFDTKEQAWEHAANIGGNFFVVPVPKTDKFTLVKIEGNIEFRVVEKKDEEG